MAKILITTIQMNVCPPPSFTRTRHQMNSRYYYHSHFLASTFDFTFFHPGILGSPTFFTACCFCIDITSFCNCIFTMHQYGQLWCFFICLFLYYRSDALLWKRCCIQNLTILVSYYWLIFIVLPYSYITLCA